MKLLHSGDRSPSPDLVRLSPIVKAGKESGLGVFQTRAELARYEFESLIYVPRKNVQPLINVAGNGVPTIINVAGKSGQPLINMAGDATFHIGQCLFQFSVHRMPTPF